MKAAILTELRKPLEVVDIEPQQHLGYAHVSVRVLYAGICGAQLNEIDGAKGPDKFLPHLLGHEAVGRVVNIGSLVTTVQPGDMVILHWRPGAGMQGDPARYYRGDGREKINAGWVTAFQELAIVSENRCTKLPDGIDPRVAPLFGCALTTAYGVVTRDAKLQPGESVLICGVGGVGLPIALMAKLVSASITAFDKDGSKTAAANVYTGAHRVHDLSDRMTFDVVVDTTGRSDIIQRAYELTKPQGRTILVGVPKHDDPITIHSLPLHFGKVLTGSHGGDSKPHEDIPRLAKLVRAGLLNLEGLVTDEYPLEQVNAAIDRVRSGEAGRVLLRMS